MPTPIVDAYCRLAGDHDALGVGRHDMTIVPVATDLPAADSVHLWTFRLHPAPCDHELLSADEIARAGRFYFQRDRDRFIAGRAELRRILSAYLGQQPPALAFIYGRSGKPTLPGPLSFNLSHTDEFAALAVARFDLGIDIERIRPIELDIADRFFAADEIASLRGLPEAQQTAAFFVCWTRKEAYLKALGDGLLLPLDRFSVSLKPTEPAQLLRAGDDPAEPSRWQFHHFAPAPNLVGAIAARHRPWRVVWRTPQS